MYEGECVYEREREKVLRGPEAPCRPSERVWVRVSERVRKRECVCEWVSGCVRERERECVCV